MVTTIKQERIAELWDKRWHYGFKKSGKILCGSRAGAKIMILRNGKIIAWVGTNRIDDIPFDIIPSLVWDGFICKHE